MTEADALAALLAHKKKFPFDWGAPISDKKLSKELLRRGWVLNTARRGQTANWRITEAGREVLVNVPGSGLTRR